MLAIAGGPSFAGIPLTWSLLFARQPEPDLEFTEEELEQTTNIRSSSPMQSPKPSGGRRPLLWILLLVLVAGGAYVAMEPETIMDLVGPLLGEESPIPQQQPPVAIKPAPPPPAPGMPTSQSKPLATAPVPPPIPAPQDGGPTSLITPAPAPMPNKPVASAPIAPPVTPPMVTSAAPPVVDSPAPLFAEGQQVAVLPDPAAPGEKVTLMQDAAATRPGPAIPPGTSLTILDGDLQNSGWVYSVRSGYGTKGWIAEKQLRLKP